MIAVARDLAPIARQLEIATAISLSYLSLSLSFSDINFSILLVEREILFNSSLGYFSTYIPFLEINRGDRYTSNRVKRFFFAKECRDRCCSPLAVWFTLNGSVLFPVICIDTDFFSLGLKKAER